MNDDDLLEFEIEIVYRITVKASDSEAAETIGYDTILDHPQSGEHIQPDRCNLA